jgi:hypothetical protein
LDVLTAQEDGADQLTDAALLDRVTNGARVLFSQDDDLLREATMRQRSGQPFLGLIYAHPLDATIGQCIEDLELIVRASSFAEWVSRVMYLPLR